VEHGIAPTIVGGLAPLVPCLSPLHDDGDGGGHRIESHGRRSGPGQGASAHGTDELVPLLQEELRVLVEFRSGLDPPGEGVGQPIDQVETEHTCRASLIAWSDTPAALTASMSSEPTRSGSSVTFSRRPSVARTPGWRGAERQSASACSVISSPSALDATAP
jgi:hypothetical protein